MASPLYKAVKRGDVPTVKRLLAEGADPDHAWHGASALLKAAAEGNQPIVQALLDAGGDVSAGLDQGKTALMGAAAGNHEPVVRLPLDAEASVDVKPHGYPLLNWLEWAPPTVTASRQAVWL